MSNREEPRRQIPVRPNLDQLQHQAKDLLKLIRAGDPPALEEFNESHPAPPEVIRLSDVQLALARSYGVASWPRLALACQLIDAIWQDDREAVRRLIQDHPRLLHEQARGTKNGNWGPPMSYAANLGRDEIIRMLHDMGATDHRHAIDRAALQGKIPTARLLHGLMGAPLPPEDALGGPAYTLSASGTALILELGGKVVDAKGRRIAPVDVVLETDSRKPSEKHTILELYVRHGLELPDTPVFALHRGRIDLLEIHLQREPKLLERTFSHEEIYPPEMGCHDQVNATQGTPLAGTTLLHMCVDYDEFEIAEWLLAKGMNPNVRSAVDDDGFGGYTALFSSVVSQPNFWMNYLGKEQKAPFTQLLLDHGADPNIRGSVRKQLHSGYGPRYDTGVFKYRDVTALGWGRQYHAKVFVSEPALQLIEAAGGLE